MSHDLSAAAQLRAEYDQGLDAATYLNAASTGPLPRVTAAALHAFTEKCRQPWTVGPDEQFGLLRAMRALCASLVGANADEIALMSNTGDGIHLAATTLPRAPGRIVLGHDGDFPANVYPWMAAEAHGGPRYERHPLTDGLVDEDALIARLDRGDVGVLTVSWVSFATGQRLNLEKLGAACRARGVYFVVDAIQGVGGAPIDVARCHIDVLACGAQKWLLSPWGTGFAYVRRELVQSLRPVTAGWLAMRDAESFAHLQEYALDYADDARKFETATLGYQLFAGMLESVSLMLSLGIDALATHVTALADHLIAGVDAIPSITLVTPRERNRRAGIVSFRVHDIVAVARRLNDANVKYSIRGRNAIRFSPHAYNTFEELDRALAVLDD